MNKRSEGSSQIFFEFNIRPVSEFGGRERVQVTSQLSSMNFFRATWWSIAMIDATILFLMFNSEHFILIPCLNGINSLTGNGRCTIPFQFHQTQKAPGATRWRSMLLMLMKRFHYKYHELFTTPRNVTALNNLRPT